MLAKRNLDEVVLKNPYPKRDFVHVEDVVEAIISAISA